MRRRKAHYSLEALTEVALIGETHFQRKHRQGNIRSDKSTSGVLYSQCSHVLSDGGVEVLAKGLTKIYRMDANFPGNLIQREPLGESCLK